MKTYDRSLEEVCEWKDQVYQQIKGFTPVEYREKIGRDARAILDEYGVKLLMVQRANMHFKHSNVVTCAENDA
jgi:hypothetical protein